MSIYALYSSGGGNTRLVVETIAEILAKADIVLSLQNVAVAAPDDLIKNERILLAAPTYDHGVLHLPFADFLQKASHTDLTGKKYLIVGLGDDKYDREYNIESARLLEKFVTEHGGSVLHTPLLINKSPIDQWEKIHNWVDALLHIIL